MFRDGDPAKSDAKINNPACLCDASMSMSVRVCMRVCMGES